MNERIQKLVARAYEICVNDEDSSTTFPEIFAELIIQECGVALSPMLRDMVSRGQAFDLIKKHFGVE
jgi:hypothetical protein